MIKDLFNLIKTQNYEEIINKIKKSKEINYNFKFNNENFFISKI